MVKREINCTGNRFEFSELFRDRTCELVRREIELREILQLRPDFSRNFAGEFVRGEDQSLELFTVTEIGRERPGEGISRQIEVLKPREGADRRRESAGEVVSV